MNELSLELVHSQITTKQKLMVSQETVDEINKLANDPDYGMEFLESYKDHLNVFTESPRNNHTQYLNAIKFFSLVEADNSLTDAYVKVFPERFERRQKGNPDSDAVKQLLRGEASRYNSSKLVNEIRKVATIPVQLIHRHLLHDAIMTNAHLMHTAKSEMVRQKAADTLIRELKPPEDQVLKVEVEDGTKSVIAELHKATKELAAEQHKSVMAGVPLKQISAARIFSSDDDIIDVEAEEVDG